MSETVTVFEHDVKKNCPNCKTKNVVEHVRIDFVYQVKKEKLQNFVCHKCGTPMEGK